MSLQVSMQDPSDRRTDTVVISPTTLTEELPRAVRGYAVEAVDRLVAELESNLNAFRTKATKLDEEKRKVSEDLARCAKELATFREKESTLLAALLSMEERKQSFRTEVESSLEQAKSEAKEVRERAQLEAARFRQDTEKVASDAQGKADAILKAAHAEAEQIRDQAYAEVESIALEAKDERDKILNTAYTEADSIAKKAKDEAAQAENKIKKLKAEFRNTVKLIRETAKAQLQALPPESGDEAAFEAIAQGETVVIDTALTAAV